MKNYYKILGLEKECSKEEIKKAYRNLAKSTHPDALSGISDEQKVIMEQRFSEINIAYKILSDENKRSFYDIRYENYINKKKEQKDKRQANNSKNKFSKRHSHIEKVVNSEKKYFKSNITFQLYRGVVHIFNEAYYRTNSLKITKDENLSKYFKRNAVTAATIIICSGFALNGIKIKGETPSQSEVTTTVYQKEDYENSRVLLNRIYTIKVGDTLSEIAYDSGVDQYTISHINNIENGRIYYNDTMNIPYSISRDNLEYYTKTKEYDGSNLAEFAIENETDIKTLVTLNKESIIQANNNYYATSSSLIVPNFITTEELKKAKENKTENMTK